MGKRESVVHCECGARWSDLDLIEALSDASGPYFDLGCECGRTIEVLATPIGYTFDVIRIRR